MTTPIYHKTDKDFQWPDDKFFYLVAKEGVYQCRNHLFFKSCVLTKNVAGLAEHKESVTHQYPRIPKQLFQRVVGFFGHIAETYDTEAIVLICYNTTTKAVEIVSPEQWVDSWPSSYRPGEWYTDADVKYKVPTLPPHLIQIGDIHSHINFSAYHSFTDTKDEKHRPGIHITIGRLKEEPPDMCASIVVDGERFEVKDVLSLVEDYEAREKFPAHWLKSFSIKKLNKSPYIHKSWSPHGKDDDSERYEQWQTGQHWGGYE